MESDTSSCRGQTSASGRAADAWTCGRRCTRRSGDINSSSTQDVWRHGMLLTVLLCLRTYLVTHKNTLILISMARELKSSFQSRPVMVAALQGGQEGHPSGSPDPGVKHTKYLIFRSLTCMSVRVCTLRYECFYTSTLSILYYFYYLQQQIVLHRQWISFITGCGWQCSPDFQRFTQRVDDTQQFKETV